MRLMAYPFWSRSLSSSTESNLCSPVKMQYMVALFQDGDHVLHCVFCCHFPFRRYIAYFLRATFPGVAIGSGWQGLVAYVNIGSYYLIGVPLGVLLGWSFNYGVPVCHCRKNIDEQHFCTYICVLYLLFNISVGNMGWNDRWHDDANSNSCIDHPSM